MRGAYCDISLRGSSITATILSRMNSRAPLACSSASFMILVVTFGTLMSICRPVMPCARPGDLEIHVAVVIFGAGDVGQDGVILAFQHQTHGDARDGFGNGTPASINASVAPHTLAMELEPFDSRMSLTTRMV